MVHSSPIHVLALAPGLRLPYTLSAPFGVGNDLLCQRTCSLSKQATCPSLCTVEVQSPSHGIFPQKSEGFYLSLSLALLSWRESQLSLVNTDPSHFPEGGGA